MAFVQAAVLLFAAILGVSSAKCTTNNEYTYSPLFQAWSPQQTDHFYYTNYNEIGQVIPGRKGNHGYTSQGISCMVLTSPAKGAVPIYRYYKGGDHFYTTNAKEIGTTTPRKRGNHGYVSEGIAGYCYPTQKKGTVPFYRYWHPHKSDHYYTTNINVIGTARHGKVGAHGYISEGIMCYVLKYKM